MTIEIVVVGCLIAIAIGLTGVGAGILTTPILITVFHVPVAAAVGTALAFGAITKVLIIPVYPARHQIDARIVLHMLAGGIPGVFAGSLILAGIDTAKFQSTISLLLGAAIIFFGLMSLYRFAHPAKHDVSRERPWALAALALPISAEVGFSSASLACRPQRSWAPTCVSVWVSRSSGAASYLPADTTIRSYCPSFSAEVYSAPSLLQTLRP
jgi:uncharacterized membrane protein YfcA